MKILILGGTGMLGYGVAKAFLESDILNYDLYVTARSTSSAVVSEHSEHFGRLKVLSFDALSSDLDDLVSEMGKPDYIINCIGVIKPFIDNNHYSSIYINSAFPHLLSDWAAPKGVKVFHITTDCVFSGAKGNYSERDDHDETDIYGRSKSIGEPENCMVLRTSIIGPEIHKNASLLAWAQSQKGQRVNGYTNHSWNGITTKEYGNVCKRVIDKGLYEHAKYHIFNPTSLSKFRMLKILSDAYGLDLEISPHRAETRCMRTLRSIHPFCSRLRIKPFHLQLRGL